MFLNIFGVSVCKFILSSFYCRGKKSDWTICGESRKRQLFYVPVSYFQVTVLMEARNVFYTSLTNSVELAPKSLFYLLEDRTKSAVCCAQGKEDSHRSII